MKIKNNKNQKYLFFGTIIILIIGLITFTLIPNLGSFYDGGNGEARYNEILIDNTGGSTLTGYQVEITIPYNPNMQTDYDDIIFTETDGTLLYHDKSSYTASTTATFYVKVDVPADSSKTIYMHHGNPDLTDSSNPENVYELYENFDSFDDTKWTGTYNDISGGVLTVASGNRFDSLTQYGAGYAIDTKARLTSIEEFGVYGFGFGFYAIGNDAINANYYGSNAKILSTNEKDTVNNQVVSNTNKALNTWIDCTIEHFSSTRVDVTINDDTISNNVDIPTINLPVSIGSRINGGNQGSAGQIDWVRVRKCVLNPPTVTIGSLFDANGNEIINYDIDETTYDVIIPVSIDASATKSYYLTKPTGLAPNPNAVYEFYEDFNGDLSAWTSSIGGQTTSYGYESTIIDGEYKASIASASANNMYVGLTSNDDFTGARIVEFDAKLNVGAKASCSLYDYKATASHFYFEHSDLGNYDRLTDASNINHINLADNTYHHFKTIIMSDNTIQSHIDGTKYRDEISSNDIVNTAGTMYWYLSAWDSGTSYLYIDNVKIRKYTANPPTAIVTDYGSYYCIDITNNEATPLSGYQITIDSSDLATSTATDSLMITENCPISISSEYLNAENATTGNDINVSVTFSDTVQNVNATITKPDNSTESVNLTNVESNTWNGTLSFTTVGDYSITNYKINDETGTIDSSLIFEILESSEETPVVPSSSGGGGSTYTPPVVEENTTEELDETTSSNELIDLSIVDDDYNKSLFDNVSIYQSIVVLFIIVSILTFMTIKKR